MNGSAASALKGLMKILGATTSTEIGNVGDSLKVSANISNNDFVKSWNKKLRYQDMNSSTNGIARNTSLSGGTWTQIFQYAGSGFLSGMIINIETFATGWSFRLTVDDEVLFTLPDGDLANDTLYDVDDVTDFNQGFLGISKGSHDRFIWHPPLFSPLYYGSSVKVEIKKDGGAKKFQAGLIILSKET